MGSFEELLESAGFERDESAVGAILATERPSPDEVDAMYDAVARQADVDSDALLLEFAPAEAPAGGGSRINVTVWYEGYLSRAERERVADALRSRFGLPARKTALGRKRARSRASA